MQIRGGSSKGLYFKKEDLPSDEKERNRYILLAMEGTLEGDPRQIDGLGGANSLTSKVAVISISDSPDIDLDYLFLQVVVGKGKVSLTQTCGNILAGIPHFAIETGLLKAGEVQTTVRIKLVNTGAVCEVTLDTPKGKILERGNLKVDGVPETAAPVICNYLYTAGATCGSLLPSGKAIDTILGINLTCIDNGMPVVIMLASDFDLSGLESKEELEDNDELKEKIEAIRLLAGKAMNLGDVSNKTIPKMCLISKPVNGGALTTRTFIPHVVHQSIGVLAAVSVGTACLISGSITQNIYDESLINGNSNSFSIEHPSGEFTVNLEYRKVNNNIEILKSGVLRTARILSKGEVYLPKA